MVDWWAPGGHEVCKGQVPGREIFYPRRVLDLLIWAMMLSEPVLVFGIAHAFPPPMQQTTGVHFHAEFSDSINFMKTRQRFRLA